MATSRADGTPFPPPTLDESAADASSEVLLLNESGMSLPLGEHEIDAVCRRVMEGEAVPSYRIEIMYVDEAEISRLHLEFLGDAGVTDNIAFSYGSPDLVEGSIAQCAQRILEQAEELGIAPRVEFARVLIHGLLHVAGHDDSTDEARNAMTVMENRYLELAGFGG